jgi:lipoic acid synthetase
MVCAVRSGVEAARVGDRMTVMSDPAPTRRRLPPWLKRPLPAGEAQSETRRLVRGLKLNTVCAEARCPNLSECWARHTATFMILGDKCTRRCRFCAVATGRPDPLDEGEPERLAVAAAQLGLRHVVITSVARDDLADEGAGHFARCIAPVRERLPEATIEVLVPDFHARPECVEAVTGAAPDVFNHNVETVPSLHGLVRPQAKYARSLAALRLAKAQRAGLKTKSGIMVGLGETREELLQVFRDLRAVGCDLLTIGQYLRPARGAGHVPVARFYPPGEFDELGTLAKRMGFAAVASGPFVRSSYFAETLLDGRASV